MAVALPCAFAVIAGIGPALAADPRYPDWPCVQAKVPDISLAAVWDGPSLEEAAAKWKDDGKVSALVPRLAARRTPLDQAEKMVTEFLQGTAAGKSEAGKLLFAGSVRHAQCAALVGHERP